MERRFRSMYRLLKVWALVALALVLMICLGGAYFLRSTAGDETGSVRSLVRHTLGSSLPIQARLVGGFSYLQNASATDLRVHSPKGSSADLARSLVHLLPTIRSRLSRLPTAEKPAEKGFVSLLEGAILREGDGRHSLDRAVEEFRVACSLPGESAETFNDLAAALVVRIGDDQSEPDLIEALDAVQRALELRPDLQEARFNLGLILEKLSLWSQARKAWEEYLHLDQRSEWAAAARTHLDSLAALTRQVDWSQVREALRTASEAGDRRRVEASLRLNPRIAREFGEQHLLAEWGLAIAEGRSESATKALNAAELLGTCLVDFNGDHLLQDAVGAIRNRATPPPGALSRLAAAHALLGQVWPLLEQRNYEAAQGKLQDALPVLEWSQSPLARWVTLYLALCHYQRSEFGSAYRLLGQLVDARDADRYPSLLARAQRVQALIQRIWGNLSAGRQLYEEALAAAKRTREGEAIAGMQVSLSGTFDDLGDRDRFWRLQLAALAHRHDYARADRLYMLLVEPARRLAHWGMPRPAEPFQKEAAEIALGSGDAVLATDAFQELSILQQTLGDSSGAVEALDASSRASDSITNASVRSFFTLENLRYRGRILTPSKPAEALRALDQAIAWGEEIGYNLVLPSAHLDRARLFRQEGKSDKAEEDLFQAVDEIDRQRAKVDGLSYRVSFFDRSQEVYNELISLALERREPERAFELSERARARVLVDQVLDHGDRVDNLGVLAASSTLQLPALQRALKPGTVLVEYWVAGPSIVAWVLDRDRVDLIRLPSPAAALEELVKGLHKEIHSGRPESTGRPILDKLNSVLIRPLESRLAGAVSLVIVPHQFLFGVPFSALREHHSGRYLVERAAITIAPSASAFVAASLLATQKRASTPAVLAVGNPTLELGIDNGPAPLPGSRAEVEAVWSTYSARSRLLESSEATREAVLSLAPQFDVLHFATHGVVDRSQPLTSHLILSRGSGPNSQHSLSVADILGLDLRGTSLVVLSSCDSAVGLASPSEGPLSLARPFLAVGVPAVVASLWHVDDDRTGAFLVRFHRALIKGLSVAGALQLAKTSMITEDPATSVEVWGAFEVYGSGAFPITRQNGGSSWQLKPSR